MNKMLYPSLYPFVYAITGALLFAQWWWVLALMLPDQMLMMPSYVYYHRIASQDVWFKMALLVAVLTTGASVTPLLWARVAGSFIMAGWFFFLAILFLPVHPMVTGTGIYLSAAIAAGALGWAWNISSAHHI